MKRIIYISLLVSSLFLLGCDENNKETSSQPAQPQSSEISNNINSSNEYTVLNASEGNLFGKEKSVLEKAQKDYQDSYSEYVRSLRESGPQTLETLQALTVYQKKYQIYQMLLKAESEK